MTKRVSRTYVLIVAAVVLALAGCGGGGAKKQGTGGAPTKAAGGPTFKASDIPFTFQYPPGFKQVDDPKDGSVLSSVTPTPGDVNNGLKVRKTAETELPFTSYAAQIRGQFEDQLTTKVTQREGTRGELKLGVLTWSKSYTRTNLGQEETVRLHSKSYFFAGSGKTWQLECLSSEEHRSEIDQACEQAIGSIAFANG
jgi:hypothetical protein